MPFHGYLHNVLIHIIPIARTICHFPVCLALLPYSQNEAFVFLRYYSLQPKQLFLQLRNTILPSIFAFRLKILAFAVWLFTLQQRSERNIALGWGIDDGSIVIIYAQFRIGDFPLGLSSKFQLLL